jgi:hypothetical protein
MPRRNKQRKPRRKAPSRRRTTTTNPNPNNWLRARVTVPLFPVSVRKRWVQSYYDFNQEISPSLGVATSRFYSANGMFDPDVSGTGHQPMGFDQMMLSYEQATVMATRISVSFIAGGNPARVGIYLSPDTTNITDPIRLVENGLLVSASLDSAMVSGTGGGGERKVTLTQTCNVAKYFGRPANRSLLNDDDLQTTAASNPPEQVYFGIVAWNPFQAASGTVVDYDVLIFYDVIYHEPRKLTVS